jgi:hypothetical protein
MKNNSLIAEKTLAEEDRFCISQNLSQNLPLRETCAMKKSEMIDIIPSPKTMIL